MFKIIKLLGLGVFIFKGIGFLNASELDVVKPIGPIKIGQVIERVKAQNLEAQSALLSIQEKNQLIKQAGLLPNPNLEVDSIFGNDGRGAFNKLLF